MKLNHYYKDYLQHDTTLSSIYEETLKNARNKTLQIQEKDIKNLEEYLNSVVYGEGKNEGKYKEAREKIYSALRKAYEEKYNSKLNENFSLSNSSASISVEDFPSIAKEMHEAFEHKNYIERSTIEQRLQNLKRYLEEINQLISSGQLSESSEKYKKIISDCNSLERDLNTLLKETTGEKIVFAQEKTDIKNLVDHMDKLYHGLSTSYGAVPPQGYGDLLEWALQALIHESDKIGEMAVDDLVNDMITNVAGSQRIGSKNSNIGISINKNELKNTPFIKKSEKDSKDIKFEILNPNGEGEPLLSFKYTSGFNYDKERQGKMDIDFSLPEPKEGNRNFRISAKNWANLKNRDFGSSNLAYTLLRTIGEEGTDLYGYIMSDDKRSDRSITQAHKVAKLSIILDILMGYSQSENFADTIVINDRSAGQIRIYSIYKIINHIDKNIKSIKISGYNEDIIHNKMSILRNQLLKSLKEGRSDTVRSLFYKYLQSVKVTLMYSNLNI